MASNSTAICNITCKVDSSIDEFFHPTLYIIVIVLGLPTNCMALWAAYLQVRQRNELGVYLINLSVADLLYIATLPLWIDYFLHHDNWVHGQESCKLFGFIFYTNIYVSIAFLCCISVDRYLAVAHPLRFAKVRRVKTAVAVSAVVWVIEVVANSAPLFHDELFQNGRNLTLCFERYPMQEWVAGMNLYRSFLGFLAPWLVMLAGYRGIVRAVRTNVSTERQEKAKIKRLALSLVLITLLCFAPYHVLLLWRSMLFLHQPCDCSGEEMLFTAYHAALALTSLNCVADPILYCFVNEGARNDVSRALARLLAALSFGGSSLPSHTDGLTGASITMETPLSTKKTAFCSEGKPSGYKAELEAFKDECLQMTILSVKK